MLISDQRDAICLRTYQGYAICVILFVSIVKGGSSLIAPILEWVFKTRGDLQPLPRAFIFLRMISTQLRAGQEPEATKRQQKLDEILVLKESEHRALEGSWTHIRTKLSTYISQCLSKASTSSPASPSNSVEQYGHSLSPGLVSSRL